MSQFIKFLITFFAGCLFTLICVFFYFKFYFEKKMKKIEESLNYQDKSFIKNIFSIAGKKPSDKQINKISEEIKKEFSWIK